MTAERLRDSLARGRLRTGGRLLIGLISGLAVAWLVIRTTAVEGLIQQQYGAAAMIAPEHPELKMQRALQELGQKVTHVSDARRLATHQALIDWPVADEPFMLEGLHRVRAGKVAEAQMLFEEAVRRNPRNRVGRVFLVDFYLRQSRIAEAIEEMEILRRLLPDASSMLVSEVARIAQHPRASTLIIEVLRKEPALREAVLDELAKKADPDLVLKIAGGQFGNDWKVPSWRRRLIDRLVESGETDRAYALWKRFNDLSSAGSKAIYDSGFDGLKGDPPFNWQFISGEDGVAELSGKGSLYVEYYGRNMVELAKQLLLLPAGSYQFRTKGEGGATGGDGRLSWFLTCAGEGGMLMEVPLVGMKEAATERAAYFAIPERCPSQWLTLRGTPGDIPETHIVRLLETNISRSGH